jgi:hypothetical protein
MNTLQLYYECWLKVTKQKRYQDKWLSDEMYHRAIKAQFPTLELLGFDRGKMNRAISTHACILQLTRTSLNQTILVPSAPRNGPRSIRGNEKKQTTGLVKTIYLKCSYHVPNSPIVIETSADGFKASTRIHNGKYGICKQNSF